MQVFYPLPVSFVVFFGGNGILSLQFPTKKSLLCGKIVPRSHMSIKKKMFENAGYVTLIHDFDTLIRKFPVCEKFYVIVFPSNGRREVMDMKNWKTRLLVWGTRLAAFAVAFAALLAPTCRNDWYQPEEPENLNQLLHE